MKTILFQGDSITDVGRIRDDKDCTGLGYVNMVSGNLGFRFPDTYKVYNRGISGDRVVDLYARWKADCINLSPDFLTILVGVNDVWHELEVQNGVETEKFEKIYDMLITETIEALPNISIVLMEPYILRYTATETHWEYFLAEVAKRREVVRKLAKKYGIKTIPLQELFDEALKKAPVDFWTSDGVHPTTAGHGLIANSWLNVFENIFHKNFND